MRGFIPPRNPEEVQLFRRYEKLCEKSRTISNRQFTAFLDLRQKELLIARANKEKSIRVDFSFGYQGDGERVVACMHPDWDTEKIDYPIDIIRTPLSGQDTLTHRDFLGAAMSLMIKREYIGDIIVNNDECFIACHDTVSSLIINELREVRRSVVSFDWYHGTLSYTRQYSRSGSATVASMRLDSVISAILKMSRSKAADIVRSSSVEVNHMSIDRTDFEIVDGDILSIRGIGKYMVSFDGNTSRKNRLFINYYRY